MHEQIVGRVVFEAEVVGDAGRHRHCGYSGVADKGVEFLALGEEEVEDLHEYHTGSRGDDEGHETESEDENGVDGKERCCLGRRTHSEAEEHCHDIGESVACGLGQASGDTALTEQVAEEEHAEQGYA